MQNSGGLTPRERKMNRKSGSGNSLSIVIPLFREGAHLRHSFQAIREGAEAVQFPCEFILVDDGSDDDTWLAIEAICRENPAARGIRFSRNFGKEAAICAGLERSSGDAVIVMDGDLQHPPEMIKEMTRLWREEGFKVVNTSRASREGRFWGYRLAAMLHGKILKMVSGFDLEGASDFKLMDRKVVDAYLQMGESRIFFRGLVAWLGFRQTVLPMCSSEGSKHGSSWGFRQLARLALTSLTSFSTLALHLVTILGLLLLAFSFALAIHTFLRWMGGNAVPGFTTVILLQLFFSSIMMIALGIIGEYIATIFHEIKNRPRYVLMTECSFPAEGADGR